MSAKTKKKEEKGQGNRAFILEQAQENYRQLLLSQVTEKSLQQRVERLTINLKQLRQSTHHKILDLQTTNDTMLMEISNLNQQIIQLKAEKLKYEEEALQMKEQIDEILKRQDQAKEAICADLRDQLKRAEIRYAELKISYDMLAHYEKEKHFKEMEVKTLRKQIEEETQRHADELTNLDKEKIQFNSQLKNEMLAKIKKTKTKLMKLNDQQLHSTTRLTVLENCRLTQELEYQSIQTEKLMQNSAQLQQQVQDLKREIEVYRQVESELARRSHHYQQVLKKYKTKVKQLEESNIQLSL